MSIEAQPTGPEHDVKLVVHVSVEMVRLYKERFAPETRYHALGGI